MSDEFVTVDQSQPAQPCRAVRRGLVRIPGSTKLVDLSPALSQAQPLLEGDDRVPDFDLLAEPLRPKYEAVRKHDLNAMRTRVEALADTRTFLRAAREWPDAFRRRSAYLGISAKNPARIESVALKWFFRDTTKGDTNLNRAADVLMAMTYQYGAEMPAADLVEAVLEEGYVKVAKRYRDTLPTRKPAPAPLMDEIENALEEHAPADATLLFRRVPKTAHTEIDVMFLVKRPGAMPLLYLTKRNEKLRRAARRLLDSAAHR